MHVTVTWNEVAGLGLAIDADHKSDHAVLAALKAQGLALSGWTSELRGATSLVTSVQFGKPRVVVTPMPAALTTSHVAVLRDLAGDALSVRLTIEDREAIKAALRALGYEFAGDGR